MRKIVAIGELMRLLLSILFVLLFPSMRGASGMDSPFFSPSGGAGSAGVSEGDTLTGGTASRVLVTDGDGKLATSGDAGMTGTLTVSTITTSGADVAISTHARVTGNATVSGSLTNSSLTSGRVPFMTTGGRFTDSSGFTVASDILTATGYRAADGLTSRYTFANLTTTGLYGHTYTGAPGSRATGLQVEGEVRLEFARLGSQPPGGTVYHRVGNDAFRVRGYSSPSANAKQLIVETSAQSELFSVDINGDVAVGRNIAVAGSISSAYTSVSATMTVTSTHSFVGADATGTDFTVNLPTAASIAGREYTVKKVDASANAVRVDGNTTQTIDGAEICTLANQWDGVVIVSNGSNWLIKATSGGGCTP